MKRLAALTLAALAISTGAYADSVYEMTCTKSELTARTLLPTYVATFNDTTRILVIDTGLKRIRYSVDRVVVERDTQVDVYGRTPFGTTYAARFADNPVAGVKEQFASFNGHKQITDSCQSVAE